jgi:CubicO group peptidase (beta-lactamase class C family)
VAGESFAAFSRSRIFEPVGLTSTQWRDDYRRIVPGRASAYAVRGGELVIDRPIEHVHGNGGLLTTVGDLLRWDRALAMGELGGPEFVRLMHANGILNDGSAIEYAAGVQVGSRNGVPQVSHTGATAGYRAFLGRYPEQGLTVALLCNVGAANPGVLGGRVVDLLLTGAIDTPTPPSTPAARAPTEAGPERFEPSPAELVAYEGAYHSADAEATFTITAEGGELVLVRRPATRIPLAPVEPDVFRGPGTFTFHRDAAGRVVELGVSIPRVHDMRFQRVVP